MRNGQRPGQRCLPRREVRHLSPRKRRQLPMWIMAIPRWPRVKWTGQLPSLIWPLNSIRVMRRFLQSGGRAVQEGRLGSCLGRLRPDDPLQPHLVQGYVGRGGIRFRKGDLDGMLSENRKAVELDPGLAEA